MRGVAESVYSLIPIFGPTVADVVNDPLQTIWNRTTHEVTGGLSTAETAQGIADCRRQVAQAGGSAAAQQACSSNAGADKDNLVKYGILIAVFAGGVAIATR